MAALLSFLPPICQSDRVRTLLLTIACMSFMPAALADKVAASAAEIHPILVGAELPDVTLKNIDSQTVKLRDIAAQKPSVLIFYRGGWCPYCNTHLADLRKIEGDLQALGFQVLAISPDQPQFLKETVSKHQLGYTLLSDSTMAASKALGLAFKVDDVTLDKYQEYGIDLEKNSGQSHHLLPVPAVILANTKGEVTFTFVAPDYKVRLDKDILLAAAQAQVRMQQSAQ